MLDWSNETAVVLASGPSLTAADRDLVLESGANVITDNATFRMAPWAMGWIGRWRPPYRAINFCSLGELTRTRAFNISSKRSKG